MLGLRCPESRFRSNLVDPSAGWVKEKWPVIKSESSCLESVVGPRCELHGTVLFVERKYLTSIAHELRKIVIDNHVTLPSDVTMTLVDIEDLYEDTSALKIEMERNYTALREDVCLLL